MYNMYTTVNLKGGRKIYWACETTEDQVQMALKRQPGAELKGELANCRGVGGGGRVTCDGLMTLSVDKRFYTTQTEVTLSGVVIFEWEYTKPFT